MALKPTSFGSPPAEADDSRAASLDLIVRAVQLRSLRERKETLFLGGLAHTRDVRGRVTPLIAALYWDCLPEFLRESGWQVVGSYGFDRAGGEQRIETIAIEIAPDEWLHSPLDTSLFAERGPDRAVFHCAVKETYRDLRDLSVLATSGAAALNAAWRAFTREKNRLHGKCVSPDGRNLRPDPALDWNVLFLDRQPLDTLRARLRRLEMDPARLRELGVRQRSGIILCGPPGTGKTLIGRILASRSTRTFLWVTPIFLKEPEAVTQVFELARLAAPTLIFIEDIDLIAQERGQAPRNLILGELMNQLDGAAGDHDLFTIATSNRVDTVEKAVRSRPGRFDQVIEIPPPGTAACRRLLEGRLEGHTISREDLDWLATKAKGRTGAELEDLCNTILLTALDGDQDGAAPKLQLGRDVLAAALEQCPAASHGGDLGFFQQD